MSRGEGNHEAGREYQRAVTEHASEADTAKLGREAQPKTDKERKEQEEAKRKTYDKAKQLESDID